MAAVAGVAMATTAHADQGQNPTRILKPGDTILFQGDSITDVGRNRVAEKEPNRQPPLGNGYAWLAAASLLIDQPDAKLKFFNRGVSGNKVFQLDERWQKDCLDIKPDVLSILIGVNDIWHMLNGQYDGTVDKYEHDYNTLIQRTKDALPDAKLVICEPFVLRCGAVDEKWFPKFDNYLAAARRVCETADATLVPFQKMFNQAIQHAPPEYWAKDGVHPTDAGAALMAHTWLRAVHA
jgi:lysophospholipase L1-like esterase